MGEMVLNVKNSVDVEKKMELLKELYKDSKSIFVSDIESVFNDDGYFNRYDEWMLKRIGVGYMLSAIELNEKVAKKLTKKNILDLIYSFSFLLEEMPLDEAIKVSDKYNLSA